MISRRVGAGARMLVPLAVAILAASVHCNVVLDIGNGAPADAAFDPASCGVQDGTCRPGQGCDRDSCSHCVCDDSHTWTCTALCSATNCPKMSPAPHSSCSVETPAGCSYGNHCGGWDKAYCTAGSWEVVRGACRDTKCPGDRTPTPMPGSPCSVKADCRFRNECGIWFDGSCDGTSWILTPPPCAPGACPTVAPSPSSPCTSEGLACEWPNGCGTYDYAVCTDRGWTVITTCKPLDCPSVAPTPGSACAGEGTTCGWPVNCEAGRLEATCTVGRWVFAPGCR